MTGDERIDMGSEEAVAWALQRELIELPVILRLVCDGEPVSKSRARFTGSGSKTRAYTPEKTRTAEDRLAVLARQAGLRGQADAEHTFGIFAKFFCETWQRRDVDNMLKLVSDALTGVVWKDDSQVTEMSAAVQRGVLDPRTHVLIYRTTASLGPTKPCEHCGQPVRIYKSLKSRFCSQACHLTWRRERRERTCQHCGEQFDHRKPAEDPKFCSRECTHASTHVSVICAACDKSFTKPRSLVRSGNSYCSPECKATYWRDRRKSAAKGTCDDCGGPTTKKTYKRCQDCNIAAGGRWATATAGGAT